MRGKFFIDTNIFVYSFDSAHLQKQEKSRDLIRKALQGQGCISWQVVQEFCNVALRKFVDPFSKDDLKRYLDSVLFPLFRVRPDEILFREALATNLETGYSWYDSLIIASAVNAGCGTLYSEDLQHKQKYRSLEILDPFR